MTSGRSRLTALAVSAWVLLLGARAGRAADAVSDSLAITPSWDVTLDRQTLFSLSTAFKTIPPAERARLVSERLQRLADDSQFTPESLRVVETNISSDVTDGRQIAVAVLDDDTLGTGLGRHELAIQRAGILKGAMLRYRQGRSARSLSWGIAASAIATLILVAALFLLRRIRRALNAFLDRWIQARREKIKARTHSMLEPDRLLAALASLLNVVAGLLTLVATYVYVGFVLSRFPWTRGVGSQLNHLIFDPLLNLGTAFVRHLPGLVFIAVLATLTHYVLKLSGFVFAELKSGRLSIRGFYPEWAEPTERIARVLIVALAVVVAYPSIPGSDSLAFKGVSIFLGVLVSLGSSSTVGNLVAGIMVVYMRSYGVGDIIQVGDQMGRVIETDVLATRLRTPWNVDITIPNATMIASNVINYSREAAGPGLILHSEVSIGYNASWRQVHAMLLRAAARTTGLLKDPAPFVRQRALGDFAITYQINGYTRDVDHMIATYHDLHKHIQDEFNEYGVEIMTPHYEVDRSQPAVVPKDRWYAPPAIPKGQPGADE